MYIHRVSVYIYKFKKPIKSLRHIRPCNCINEKIAIKTLGELTENIIVKEGGSIKGLMFD